MMDLKTIVGIFSADEYAKMSEVEIVDVSEESATVRVEVKPHHLNANKVVQGGMLFTAADVAFAVLTNFLHPMTVSQCGNITFLSPARTTYFTATAKELAVKGHNCVGEVVIRNDVDEVICTCNFNGFIKPMDKDEYIEMNLKSIQNSNKKG